MVQLLKKLTNSGSRKSFGKLGSFGSFGSNSSLNSIQHKKNHHDQKSKKTRFTVFGLLLPLVVIMSATVLLGTYSVTQRSLRALEEGFAATAGERKEPLHIDLHDLRNDDKLVSQVQYPIEDPIPNPDLSTINGNATFSGCMLVMDDNHRLVEWLAYHYHVLPLRYLIVAIDPRSKTSPTYLFNRWRRQGMYIEEWSDKDFWVERKPIHDHSPFQEKRDRHRGRQKFFYKQCMIRLKEDNRTWVALHDSDEFMVYNHDGKDEKTFQQSLEKARQRQLVYKKDKGTFLTPSKKPPTVGEPGAMIHYIRQEQAAGREYYQSPCLGIPRTMFGAAESSEEERNKDVPEEFKSVVPQLDTLRWRKHARRNDFVKNALGKVMMDVSRIDIVNAPYFMSLHRPIKSICSPPWHNDWESGLRIYHYLGSWDSYSFRDDARRGGERSREQWEYKATVNGDETDDTIRPWLGGFVQEVGSKRAMDLVGDAGLPNNYKHNNATAWLLLPDKLEAVLKQNNETSNDAKLLHFSKWIKKRYSGDTAP